LQVQRKKSLEKSMQYLCNLLSSSRRSALESRSKKEPCSALWEICMCNFVEMRSANLR